ncbi:MAG: hypothetical protein ABSG17_06330 [Spirochaetia bacterium]|jgi:hypothetical protein
MIENVTIVSGGKLSAIRWVEKEDEWKKSKVDLTNYAPNWLFLPCTVDENVVLRDVYLLLHKHVAAFTEMLSDHVPNIVEEGLSPYVGEKAPLTFALLSWEIGYSKTDAEMHLYGNTLPVFHVFGQSEQEKYDAGVYPANQLAELPLRLSRKLIIYKEDSPENQVFENPEYSLWNILCAILQELSRFGSPEERDRKLQDLSHA